MQSQTIILFMTATCCSAVYGHCAVNGRTGNSYIYAERLRELLYLFIVEWDNMISEAAVGVAR